jgi:hypothetical protein
MSKPLPIGNYSISQLQQIYQQRWKVRMFKDIVMREVSNFINMDMDNWFLRSDPLLSGRSPNTGVRLYDWTAPQSSLLCAEGLIGYGFSGVFFRLEFDDEKMNDAAGKFLQNAERQMYKQLAISPWKDELRIFLRSFLDYGTAIQWRQENAAIGRPSYKTLHLNRCYIDNNEWGDVDVLIRDIWMSAQSAVAEYGYEECPPQIQDAYDHNKDHQWLLHSFCFPQEKYDLDFEVPSAEYAEITLPSCDWYHPIRIDPHQTKPFFAARYMRSYDSGPWGVGAPGTLQLGNVKMLNAMSQDMLRISQRLGDPTIIATLGARGRISRVPGDINYMTPGNSYSREKVDGDPRMLEERYQSVQKIVRSAYHEDFFNVLTQNLEQITKSTATGVNALQGEKAAMLAAFSSRLEYEYCEPNLKDLFFMELRSGRLGEAPRTAKGRPLKLNFVGPLWQMQRQQLILNATMAALQQINALAQMQLAAGQPGDVLDNFDLSAYARDIAVSYDVAKDVLRNMMDVANIRKGRAMAAQQQAETQQRETESRMNLERGRAAAANAKASIGQVASQPVAQPQPSTMGNALA